MKSERTEQPVVGEVVGADGFRKRKKGNTLAGEILSQSRWSRVND